jgi:AraC family cel operon transcriptional repressor
MIQLLEKYLIDPETDMHYAYHTSIKNITDIHWHDFFEIFLITKGSLYHFINGHKQLLAAGSLCFIRPSDVHYYGNDGSQPCELLNLAFPHRTADALFDYLADGLEADLLLSSELPPCKVISPYQIEIIKHKIQEITFLPGFNKKQMKAEVRVLLAEIFINCFSNRPEITASIVPAWLERLADEMRNKDNFAQGLPRLYELSGKSPEHLTRMIKKHLGKTPTEWINEMRLQYAANLLTHTDEAILTISLEAGFENLSHFYHRFKDRFQCTPAKFRKENRKIAIPISKPLIPTP